MKGIILTVTLLLSSFCFSKELKIIELTENNSIAFDGGFTPEFVAKKQQEVITLAAKGLSDTLYIVVNSPGGSVSHGQLFFSTVQAYFKNVHTITIFAASMGYNLVQAMSGSRYIIPSGVLMSHRASLGGLSGQLPGEIDQRLNMFYDTISQSDEVSAKRVGLTVEKYKELIHDELWLVGQSAVTLNHADETVLVKCDRSLNGVKHEDFRSFFGSVSVTKSRCPIVTSPLSLSGSNEAIDLYMTVHDTTYLLNASKTK